MSKAKAKAKQAKGRLKESAGSAMDNRKMQAEGAAERIAGTSEEMLAKAGDKTKRAKGGH
ncbi:CsbD family protein [Streptomyces subrutilus]|uniref:CsbD family protein n=1 Tax=Streptomyces subrutilus TaxID=36818 RepID=UPI0033E7569C